MTFLLRSSVFTHLMTIIRPGVATLPHYQHIHSDTPLHFHYRYLYIEQKSMTYTLKL